MFLEGDVFPSDVAVLTQEIPECQRASLFVSAGLNDVNMMRVRPFTWSMKERTHGIVSMRHVKSSPAWRADLRKGGDSAAVLRTPECQ